MSWPLATVLCVGIVVVGSVVKTVFTSLIDIIMESYCE